MIAVLHMALLSIPQARSVSRGRGADGYMGRGLSCLQQGHGFCRGGGAHGRGQQPWLAMPLMWRQCQKQGLCKGFVAGRPSKRLPCWEYPVCISAAPSCQHHLGRACI